MSLFINNYIPVLHYYRDGEEEGSEGNKGKESMTPAEGDPPQMLSKSEVDKLLASKEVEYKSKNEQTIKRLEEAQKQAGLSKETIATLQQEIDELRTQNLTAEQQKKLEQDRLANAHKEEVNKLAGERDSWKTNYTNHRIKSDMITAASDPEHDLFNAEQFYNHFRADAEMVPVDGQEGQFEVKINFDDVDPETKKPVRLKLGPSEVIERMKAKPTKWGNFFKSSVVSGIGGRNEKAGDAPGEYPTDPAEYRKQREKTGLPTV